MIVHCMISVLFSVYKLAYFGIQLTNTVSVFRLESSPVVTRFANFHNRLKIYDIEWIVSARTREKGISDRLNQDNL